MAPLKTYVTYTQLALKLGFIGKRGAEPARKWVERRSIPRRWRGNAWLVAEEDAQASLDGKSFARA